MQSKASLPIDVPLLRRMEKQDLAEVLAIQDELKFQEWKESHFQAEIDNVLFSLPFVLENGKILAYAVMQIQADEAELCTIAVRASFQGLGLGSLLLESLQEILVQRKVNACFLEVRASNLGAQALYHKTGFVFIGTRKKYYPDGENALILRWKNVCMD